MHGKSNQTNLILGFSVRWRFSAACCEPLVSGSLGVSHLWLTTKHLLAVLAKERAGHVDRLLDDPVGTIEPKILQPRQALEGAGAELARVQEVEARGARLAVPKLGRAHHGWVHHGLLYLWSVPRQIIGPPP